MSALAQKLTDDDECECRIAPGNGALLCATFSVELNFSTDLEPCNF